MEWLWVDRLRMNAIKSRKSMGYTLSKTKGVPHTDDAIWKLYDGKTRIATLDSTGKIIR